MATQDKPMSMGPSRNMTDIPKNAVVVKNLTFFNRSVYSNMPI